LLLRNKEKNGSVTNHKTLSNYLEVTEKNSAKDVLRKATIYTVNQNM